MSKSFTQMLDGMYHSYAYISTPAVTECAEADTWYRLAGTFTNVYAYP